MNMAQLSAGAECARRFIERQILDMRWLDDYVGGGVDGDLCVRATLNEKALRKDGFCLSLLGACGLQWNMTERLGLFVEPQLSWTSPSKTPVLATYRTDHPFVFTVATGIRINVKK